MTAGYIIKLPLNIEWIQIKDGVEIKDLNPLTLTTDKRRRTTNYRQLTN